MITKVIVGRFQIDEPHEGHRNLFLRVSENETKNPQKIVFVIGNSPVYFTNKNPIPADLRAEMVKEHFGNDVDVIILDDHKDDNIWSQNLDKLLEPYENPMLYGCRDSFIGVYNGIHPAVELPLVIHQSSTELREKYAKRELGENNDYFRQGIIYATENRFPTAYPTVDIVVYRQNQILLGRKKGMDKWVFIGGFVDPTDETLEAAAERELNEEVKGITISPPFEYISSHKIDDWRYKGTKDGIITTLFKVNYIEGTPIASDDIEEVKWFNIYNLYDYHKDELLAPQHHVLLDSYMKNL